MFEQITEKTLGYASPVGIGFNEETTDVAAVVYCAEYACKITVVKCTKEFHFLNIFCQVDKVIKTFNAFLLVIGRYKLLKCLRYKLNCFKYFSWI